ncbi:MAG TPA: septum formation initiator family protein [Bacteroidia bacterium]|jgi:cell division protein FtsB|nr:septum formation initiator family protein [Bacteroidia bacterium]
MKKAWEKVPYFLKNKYAICIIAFVVWLAFFDKNDFYAQYRFRQQLNTLKNDKSYYADELEKSKSDLNELISSPANLEKFAREKYLMKKDDEDIFVFVEK